MLEVHAQTSKRILEKKQEKYGFGRIKLISITQVEQKFIDSLDPLPILSANEKGGGGGGESGQCGTRLRLKIIQVQKSL